MQDGQDTSASSSPVSDINGAARELNTNSIVGPHLLSSIFALLEQSLLQCLGRNNPSHAQRTGLFQPNSLRHQETHSRVCYQELCKAACVTVFAAIDDACNSVAFVERRGVGIDDRAGEVAAN